MEESLKGEEPSSASKNEKLAEDIKRLEIMKKTLENLKKETETHGNEIKQHFASLGINASELSSLEDIEEECEKGERYRLDVGDFSTRDVSVEDKADSVQIKIDELADYEISQTVENTHAGDH